MSEGEDNDMCAGKENNGGKVFEDKDFKSMCAGKGNRGEVGEGEGEVDGYA